MEQTRTYLQFSTFFTSTKGGRQCPDVCIPIDADCVKSVSSRPEKLRHFCVCFYHGGKRLI